jgi:DNA-binding CsgD family transcriptional regulator
VPARLRVQRHRVMEPRVSLRLRAFAAHLAVIVGGAAFLALSPVTVSWPLVPLEGGELAAWVLVISVVYYLALGLIFQRRRPVPQRLDADVDLTPRELEILRLIADSYTTKEIAETLCISPKTVAAHRGHILRKLGVKDRVALTRYAIKRGLVDP